MSDGNRDNLGSILGLAAKLIVGGALAAGAGYAAYNAFNEVSEQNAQPSLSHGTRSRPSSQPWTMSSNSSQRETLRPLEARRQRGPANCCLCDETLIGRSMSRAQPCQHIFHEECITTRTVCPECSRRIIRLQ